jgi:hypothetical protein
MLYFIMVPSCGTSRKTCSRQRVRKAKRNLLLIVHPLLLEVRPLDVSCGPKSDSSGETHLQTGQSDSHPAGSRDGALNVSLFDSAGSGIPHFSWPNVHKEVISMPCYRSNLKPTNSTYQLRETCSGAFLQMRDTYRITHACIPSAVHKVGKGHQEERKIRGGNAAGHRLQSAHSVASQQRVRRLTSRAPICSISVTDFVVTICIPRRRRERRTGTAGLKVAI